MAFDAEFCESFAGVHLSALIKAVRAGEIPRLRWTPAVPVIPCRLCHRQRLDDGRPCGYCGAYQSVAISSRTEQPNELPSL